MAADQNAEQIWTITDLRVPASLSTKGRDLLIQFALGRLSFTAKLSHKGSNFESPNPFRPFKARPSEKVLMKIFARHRLLKNEFVGEIEDTIQDLIDNQASNGLARSVIANAGSHQGEKQLYVEFAIQCPDIGSIVHQSSAAAEKALAPPVTASAVTQIDGLQDTVVKTVDFLSNFQVLFDRVDIFVKLCDQVAEVHPYAKMAWSVLSFIPKVVVHQVQLDATMNTLVDAMSSLFDFVEGAKPLNRDASYRKTLIQMTLQITECGHFITSYVQDRSFWKRAVKNIASTAEKKIDEFLSTISELKQAFQLDASRNISIAVLSIVDSLDNQGDQLETLVMDNLLERLPYSKTARHNPDKRCLPGTRTQVIEDILNWATDPNGSSVFLLTGVAGSGKSAVVHTVATLFAEQKRLGSSFCFNRGDPTDRKITQLFCTIARDLALREPRIKQDLYKVIHEDESLLRTPSFAEQFKKFILEPTQNVELVGPTIVLVDALDESDSGSRSKVIDIFSEGGLPKNIRFLFSSRPEEDILMKLRDKPHVVMQSLESVDKLSTENDIYHFIDMRFSSLPQHLMVRETQIRALAQRSEGLFQWAATMCRFVLAEGQRAGVNRRQRLDQMLGLSTAGKAASSTGLLDQIYTTVLISIVNPEDSESFETVKRVLRHIFTAIEPLSTQTLVSLFPSDAPAVEDTLPFLGSLFSGATDRVEVIRPLHTSLRDFFLNKARAKEFYVDTEGHHIEFSSAAFRALDSLQFNVANVATASHANSPDSAKDIPGHLKYACIFFSRHLELEFSEESVNAISHFLHNKVLFWLEQLSLLGQFRIGAPAMTIIVSRTSRIDPDLADFALDLQKFIRSFAAPISLSAFHVYVSALPLSPKSSLTYRHFASKFPFRAPLLPSGGLPRWPNVNLTVQCDAVVESVAFTPDGKTIVTGLSDDTVRVWDAETGDAAGQPLQGHTDWVNSVAISLDGTRIVSGSADGTVRVWNAKTGDAIGQPLQDHNHEVSVSSVTISPDGKRIVSSGKILRVWDADTGKPVGQPLQGHEGLVISVTFSPDGRRIASGSDDMTIRVWNAETGDAVGQPLQGHQDWVHSVAFSPDGKKIASGSEDMTVRLWDPKTGDPIGQPLQGHEHEVNSVNFSPDGKRIASGSEDKTVRIWDTETGVAVGNPLLGHEGSVNSVALSPGGRRIASGSSDRTMRVWDAETGEVGQLQQGHREMVCSVAFSGDGKRITSGSDDMTVRVWNAETGDAVGKPLQANDWVKTVAFSPDGKRVASGSLDRTVQVWDLETGNAVGKPLQGLEGSVTSVAFSPDGKRVVAGAQYDLPVRVWDAETGDQVGHPLEGHDDSVCSVAFSPDGKRIASGSEDMTVRVWDVETGDAVGEPLEGHGDSVTSVAFSPDGKRIASGSYDMTVQVWDVEMGKAVGQPLKHEGGVTSVAFSPDGKTIVSGSQDKTVRVWDAETGETIGHPLKGHKDSVFTVTFSPDGARILSASSDKTVRVWDNAVGDHSGDTKHPPVLHEAVIGDLPSNWHDGSQFFFGVQPQDDGWVVGPESELMLWYPEELRNAIPFYRLLKVFTL